MDLAVINQIEATIIPPIILAMVGWGLSFLSQKLKLQKDSTAAQLETSANAAIQQASKNFAARVSTGLLNGSLTRATAVAQLSSYLLSAVGDSMELMKPNLATLETILLGKVKELTGQNAPGVEPLVSVAQGATPQGLVVDLAKIV